MSRFAHFNPDDPEGAWDALIDRADHARKEARENGDPQPRATRDPSFADEIFNVVREATAALYPGARHISGCRCGVCLVERHRAAGKTPEPYPEARIPETSMPDKYAGVEIDHDSTDALSAIIENGGVTIDIGEDWAGRHHGPHRPQGFQRYTCITLTPDEATKLCDWLAGALVHLRGEP